MSTASVIDGYRVKSEISKFEWLLNGYSIRQLKNEFMCMGVSLTPVTQLIMHFCSRAESSTCYYKALVLVQHIKYSPRILSPILFTVDVSYSGKHRCWLLHHFVGYSDDIAFIAPSSSALRNMLDVCITHRLSSNADNTIQSLSILVISNLSEAEDVDATTKDFLMHAFSC